MSKKLRRRAVLKGSDLAVGGLATGVVAFGAGGPDAAGRSPILLGRVHQRWRAIRRATLFLLLIGASLACGLTAPSPAMAQMQPGTHGGLFVVKDAVAQFGALNSHPDPLGWVNPEDKGAPDPSVFDHYQGLVRNPQTGIPPVFYVTQLQGDKGGYLSVVRFESRTTSGERLRSNLRKKGEKTEDTAPPSGSGPIVSGLDSSKCVDVSGGKFEKRDKVVLWTCHGGANQTWLIADDGTIRAGGGCLDIKDGKSIIWWTCHAGGNQKWEATDGGLKNPASGKCLDAAGGKSANGTPLQVYTCNGTAAQKWTLRGTTAPSDTWLRSIRFDGDTGAPVFGGERLPAYKHPGGMAVVDDVLFVPVDQPVSAGGSPAGVLPAKTGYLLLFDVKADPTHPVPLRALPLGHGIDNVAVTRGSDGKYLILTNGDGGQDMNVYTTTSTDLRDPNLGLTLVQHWKPRSCYYPDYPPFVICSGTDPLVPPPPDGPEWPTGTSAYQSSTFLRDSHGTLYLIGMRHPGGLPTTGSDYADLYKVEGLGSSQLKLRLLTRRYFYCNFAFAGRVCNFAAADNAYVSPSGELFLYSSPHDDEDGFSVDGIENRDIVRMAEFRDRDVLHAGNPLLEPTLQARGCQFGGGQTAELLGPSAPAADRPWVELYDDSDFKDRFIMVDYDDRGLFDLGDFKNLDGFNDKTSSVRWRAPKGCNVVLYDDAEFEDRRIVLFGTGKTESISNLKSGTVRPGVVEQTNPSKGAGEELAFNDKTSSLAWQQTSTPLTFTNPTYRTTLALRFASVYGAAPLSTIRVELPEDLRPTRMSAGNFVLPRLLAGGHPLLRRYITLRGNELTVRLRDARSVQLRWSELRASPSLAAALRARLQGKRLNVILLVTDANGHTQRLQLVKQPRLPPRPPPPTVTG